MGLAGPVFSLRGKDVAGAGIVGASSAFLRIGLKLRRNFLLRKVRRPVPWATWIKFY